MKRTRERDPIPLRTREAVWDRSGGVCECGCQRRANHIHHRKLRSQGGTNDLTNLCHLNNECHEWAHKNRTESELLGLIVASWADPASVPVLRRDAA